MPIRRLLHKYWFKPARMGWVAVYYPSLFPGWVLTFLCLFFLFYFFMLAQATTDSFIGFLVMFGPKAIIIFLIFDLFCFRTGEYPYWWKTKSHLPHE